MNISEEEYSKYRERREQEDEKRRKDKEKLFQMTHTRARCGLLNPEKEMKCCRTCWKYVCESCSVCHIIEFSGDREEWWYYCKVCEEEERKRQQQIQEQKYRREMMEKRYQQEKGR
jgi:hypothetical protein